MDGLTAVKHIRQEEADGSLASNLVIALSESTSNLSAVPKLTCTAGNARQGQIDEAKAAGMDDVVIKPYRLVSPVHLLSVNKANIQDDLLQKIENMMRIRASRNTIDAVSNSAVETPGEIEMGE